MQSSETNNSRNNYTLIGAVAVIILAVAVFLFAGGTGDATQEAGGSADKGSAAVTGAFTFPEGSGLLENGAPAWNFALSDVDGNTVSLNDYAGQPIVINYWASWCGPCRIEFPHLQEAKEKYGDNVVFLTVNQKEDAATIEDYFAELGLDFTALLDSEGQVAADYGVGRTLPTTFFITSEGNVAVTHRGPMTLGQIEGYIADTTQ